MYRASSALAILAVAALGWADDTMFLTDEPGNWFKSVTTNSPLSVIDPGDEVDFKIDDCCTNTRHTVTLLVKPVGSQAEIDQDSSQKGTLSAEFDLPGVYVVVCKIHPYMTGVVAVRGTDGQIPDVTAGSLPFLRHLGVQSLPAATVLSVMTTVAPDDAAKLAKWDILDQSHERRPSIPGVGEVWVNSQFERVPGQADERGVAKPGTITILDAASFRVEREVNGLTANGLWNNPHNMWANFRLDTVYNGNWFGKWVNKIDRATGSILGSVTVGEAPTHIVTIPAGPLAGLLTIPLSADNDLVKVADGPQGLRIVDKSPTGNGKTHPHAHWLTCGEGDRVVVPNVFTGIGVGGSVSVMDSDTGSLIREFSYDPADPLASALQMPVAVGECHVNGRHKAYVANIVSGMVTVLDVDGLALVKNIPVTLTPDGKPGFGLLDTLQVPIQTPVSPDERWAATAVLSLTNVARANTGEADHVAIIDTWSDRVVAYVPTPAGTHGVNWGAKLGGGYYAYVTNQHANVLTVIDPDPNGDDNGTDAAAVGTLLLANASQGAGPTDGCGGQGVKPLPMTHDGWIQPTCSLSGSGQLSQGVEGWLALLTPEQKDPDGHAHFALPDSFTIEFGRKVEGEVVDLLSDDDSRLSLAKFVVPNQLAPPVRILVEATSPNPAPSSMSVIMDTRASVAGLRQTLELFDFASAAWVETDARNATLSDSKLSVPVPNPARFVQPGTGRVRSRLSWKPTGPVPNSTWTVGVDQTVWRVG
ncbi:MAG: hypothetical protein IT207_11105 [Fimbriimonadaceae bacterium]|nr:hypothetical protein [Fimbriimonadaceae bacterium]